MIVLLVASLLQRGTTTPIMQDAILETDPINVSIATKEFGDKPKLKRHEATHSNFKPFKCNECSASFITNDNLLQHIRHRHKERNFSCKNCEYTFYFEGDLRKHKLTHTKAKRKTCEHCEKKVKNCHWLRHCEFEKKEDLSETPVKKKGTNYKKEIVDDTFVKRENKESIDNTDNWNKTVRLIESKIKRWG